MRIIAILIVAITILNAQFQYQELIHFPWGKADHEVGLRHDPGGPFGPTSFRVQADTVLIMDTQNRELKSFLNQTLISSIDLPYEHVDDFAFTKSNTVRFLVDDPTSRNLDQHAIRTSRVNQHTGEVFINGELAFDITAQELGSVLYIDSTPDDNLYLRIETITQQVPLQVNREIHLYSNTGILKAKFKITPQSYTYIPHEFYVDSDGSLYQMVSTADGITIIGWHLIGEFPDEVAEYTLPEYFFLSTNPEDDEIPNDVRDGFARFPGKIETLDFQPVTPQEALAIGDTYVQHQWIANAGNITNGRIVDPNGVDIETPAWVQIGTNYHVSYKWGGFNTLSGFDAGLANGKYAGDRATSCEVNYCVSSYCVGVDCSGFVSRCWLLPTHYSTRMMDDYITIAYDSWDELKPGDAVHKEGHVRLFVYRNTDGSLLTVEASGYDWKVSYRSYTLSQLSNYTPRYYIYMEGTPGTVPRPELQCVVNEDSLQLIWSAVDSSLITGYHLYGRGANSNWRSVDTLAENQNDISFSPENSDSLIFYKLFSVSSYDSTTESLPTDFYGSYNGDSPEKILIVDGFDRVSGSYALPYHPFAMTMGQALLQWDIAFNTADNNAILDSLISLADYHAVFWLLGDESTQDETFSHQEQLLVQNYLRQGGRLFVTGSEVAWDLDQQGDSQDSDFIRNYLKVEMAYDDAGSYTVTGETGTLFEGLSLHYDDGSHGVYEEDYPDAYYSTSGSTPVLRYANNRIAGTEYTGMVSGGQQPAQVLMLGFPFETIYNESERVALMARILAYFGYDVQQEISASQLQPQTFALYQNYPNPFNPVTTIRFDLPELSHVTLTIYDLLGREVKTLINSVEEPGYKSIVWDATDNFSKQVGAGIYIYQIRTREYTQTKKTVLLK